MSRRELLLGAAAAAVTARAWGQGASSADPTQSADAAKRSLAAAVEYLWSQQADDGGWHSPQYGLLKSGQALTPFVLFALLEVSERDFSRPVQGVANALQFIRQHVDEHGALGRADADVLEYPIYSTSYALRCLIAAENAESHRGDDTALIEKMYLYLMTAQFDVDAGFTIDSPAFGGWGFDKAPRRGDPGHMDLAHTRRALEAIRAAQPRLNGLDCNHAFKQALQFLHVVQKHPQAAARPQLADDGPSRIAPPPSFDGGFYFSPVVLDANKGGEEKKPAPHWRSYATATCDGILALLAAGVPRDDERVVAAATWLKAHGNLEYPEGVPEGVPEQWGAAIKFYHYAVRAEAYRALDWPAAERARLATVVRAEQDADGSFVNRVSPLMKEDDPVLCTALATVALSNC